MWGWTLIETYWDWGEGRDRLRALGREGCYNVGWRCGGESDGWVWVSRCAGVQVCRCGGVKAVTVWISMPIRQIQIQHEIWPSSSTAIPVSSFQESVVFRSSSALWEHCRMIMRTSYPHSCSYKLGGIDGSRLLLLFVSKDSYRNSVILGIVEGPTWVLIGNYRSFLAKACVIWYRRESSKCNQWTVSCSRFRDPENMAKIAAYRARPGLCRILVR